MGISLRRILFLLFLPVIFPFIVLRSLYNAWENHLYHQDRKRCETRRQKYRKTLRMKKAEDLEIRWK